MKKKPHVVIKLAGLNGSGKTTLARAMAKLMKMELAPTGRHVGERSPTGKVLSYFSFAPTALDIKGLNNFVLIGSYATTCGGMDTINNQVDKMRLVRQYAVPGNLVLFEGILTGVTYGAFGAMSEEPNQYGRWLYAFMGTSYPECVARVEARRKAAHESKLYLTDKRYNKPLRPFDPLKSMHPKVRAFESVERRAMEAGHSVVVVNPATPEAQAKFLLKEALKLI